MNVGYHNVGMDLDVNCPLCGSDVYISKYGTDYKCVNKQCVLNRKASVIIEEIQQVMSRDWGAVK